MDADALRTPAPHARRSARGALLAVLVTSPASAAAWLSGHDLKRHCDAFAVDADSAEAAACIAFVQGFIATGEAHDGGRDATIHGEPRVALGERAGRTRGGARLRALLAERNRYCIADDSNIDEIVRRVSAYLAMLDAPESGRSVLSERAEHAVQLALVASFPCSGR